MDFDWGQFLQFTITGLSVGMVYALIALGFALIWKSSSVANLALGQIVLISSWFTYAMLVQAEFPQWLAFPLVILFVVAFFRFFFHLPRKTKILFGLAGGLYVGGAIGFEMVGAGYVTQYGKQNFTYIIIAMIEESMEVTGLVFLIYALLDYVSSTYDSKRFKLVISESDGLQLIEDG